MPPSGPPKKDASEEPQLARFRTLPENIRAKIKKQGAEMEACWWWDGAYDAGKSRVRYRPYHSHEHFEGMRQSAGRHLADTGRRTPKVQDPLLKKVRPGHRVVYGLLTCTRVDDVPKLKRCDDDRCVNPRHMTPVGPPPVRPQATEAPQDISGAPIGAVDVMSALKAGRSELMFDGTPESCEAAAEILGLPPGSVSPEIAAEFIAWEQANPFEDDEL